MREAKETLVAMRSETERELAAMEEEYEQNHGKMAAEILKRMIGE